MNSVQKAPLPRRWIYDRVDGAVARHIRTKNEEGEKKKNKTLIYRNGNNMDLHVFYVIHHHY